MVLDFLKKGLEKRATKKNDILLVSMATLFAAVIAAVIIFLMVPSLSCKVSVAPKEKDLEGDSLESSPQALISGSTEPGSKQDKLIVGSDISYPSFSFLNNGNPDGFDIDIAKEISKRMGKEIEIVPVSWSSIYEEIGKGNIDMAISAVPLLPDKEKIADFSTPYFTMEYLLISFKGMGVKVKEDLNNRLVGILKIEKDNLKKEYLANFQILPYENIVNMLDDLKNRKIEGVLLSLPMSINVLKENRDVYIILDRTGSNLEFVIVFKEGSDLKEEVDRILKEIREDGTYQKIYDKWFGL